MTKSTRQAILFYSLAAVISIIIEVILNNTIGFIKYEVVDGVTLTYMTPAFAYFSMIAMGLFLFATILSIRAVDHDDELTAQIKREIALKY